MNNSIQEKLIKGHEVYIFEKHHHALFPWSKIKADNIGHNFILFSFDHHTDTHDPFLCYCYHHNDKMDNLISKMNFNEERSVNDAVLKLKNDEHIKTALKIGIFDKAFIISHSNTDDFPVSVQEKERIEKFAKNDPEYLMQIISGNYGITPRAERTYEESDIYMPPFDAEGYWGENDVLEDGFLAEKMVILSRMCSNIISAEGEIKCDYILDIDLDYFHTMKSIDPSTKKIFSQLVKSAKAITIAKESICVEIVRREKIVTSDILLEKLLELLEFIL
jgi:hypothetical protein